MLAEQFCLGRTYAIASGEARVAQVQGFTSQEITAQCAAFASAVRDIVAALTLRLVSRSGWRWYGVRPIRPAAASRP